MMTDNKKRHLLHVFSTFKVGGPQRRFAQLVDALGPSFVHTIISMDDRWEALDLLPDGSQSIQLRLPQDQRTGFGLAGQIFDKLRRSDFDVLVTYNWGAIEWAALNLLFGHRHVHIEDGFRPDEIQTRKFRRNVFRRLVLRRNCKVVVISETLREIALNEWKISAGRVLFIPNGISIEKFSTPANSASRSDYGLSDNAFVIGTIAALRPEKNLDALIRAVAQLSDKLNAHVLIAGDGPEMGKLKAQTDALGLNEKVKFAGHTETPESLYGLFDMFALSSTTEQMPLSVIEAMAAHLPVAAYDVGDVANMVAPENMPYIVDKNEDCLSWAMEKLGQDHRQRKVVGDANHKKALQDFSQQKMVEAYRRLFS